MLPAEGGRGNFQPVGDFDQPDMKGYYADPVHQVDWPLVECELEEILESGPGDRQQAHSLFDASRRREVGNILHQMHGVRSILVYAVAVEPRSLWAVLDETRVGEFLGRAQAGGKQDPNALKTSLVNAEMLPSGPDLHSPVGWKWVICLAVVRRVNIDLRTCETRGRHGYRHREAHPGTAFTRGG
jgi:hypothetical protein